MNLGAVADHVHALPRLRHDGACCATIALQVNGSAGSRDGALAALSGACAPGPPRRHHAVADDARIALLLMTHGVLKHARRGG